MILSRRNLLILAAALGISAGPAVAQETLNVGSYPNNPPFEFKGESGNFEGFEVDIVTEAAKRLGMNVDIQGLDFQPLFAATSSGRIDVAISSITITQERLGSQSFTQPYYDSDMGIAAKKDGEVKSLADLKGKIVGVLSGSTGDKWSKEHQSEQGFAEIKGYNTQQEVLLDLSAGRIDGVVSDVPGMGYAFTKMQGLAVVDRIKTGEQYGLMMTKNHPLLGKINDALTEMKKDGTLAAIHKKWFGTEPPADSSTVVEAPLPKA
ncbi:amino acid ABC transporter substrate-binding protein [Pseudaminobacter sp. 19-2017]|uniref:Amino acid ABC transporter substrate-binding protein n=1 Tax=Pseudaminobacter soli (ex Zhang et al. 2022) TaxID=2831468 RepID=A0A942I3V3_9HYPH|nr:ABC transporter substrate-binding protein [Pseudaminobacter soli]MBS3650479.1 amino acid ABC transporter substrate-binding protein [Pseudaminobacter soli]